MVDREDLLAQARRRYEDYLRSVVEGTAFFPLALRIGKTRRAESYAERAVELVEFRTAAAALRVTVEWRTVNDPRFGPHERPERAYFADETAFLTALGKGEEAHQFREDLALIRAECPALETWLPENPRVVVEHHGVWPELLRVVQWFRMNPRSALYLRQLPVECVDTKFFERHSAILDALLLHVHPESVTIGERRFEARHGLRWEEPLVRLRFLDSELQNAHGFPVADLAVPAPVFRALPLGCVTAIVTENLRNFLALPPLPCSVVVLGSGDAASLLTGAPWLAVSRILYWGDLDARGFAILARLRDAYAHTESVLMDLGTLKTHARWTVRVAPSSPDLLRLCEHELAGYHHVCRDGLRLEQERIPFPVVEETFSELVRR